MTVDPSPRFRASSGGGSDADRAAYARRVIRHHYPTSLDNPAGSGWCAFCLAFDTTRHRWPCAANRAAARYLAWLSRDHDDTPATG